VGFSPVEDGAEHQRAGPPRGTRLIDVPVQARQPLNDPLNDLLSTLLSDLLSNSLTDIGDLP
jgi:hypothetical protein